MLDPVSVIAAGAAAGGLGLKISQPLLKHHLSGHFLTLQGGQYMDRTIDILGDEDLSAGILPKAKQRYLELHERSDSKQSDTQHHFDAHDYVSLQPTRQSLEKTTDSVTGSIRHCFKAKTFHSNAKSLFQKTKSASDSARVRKQLKELNPGDESSTCHPVAEEEGAFRGTSSHNIATGCAEVAVQAEQDHEIAVEEEEFELKSVIGVVHVSGEILSRSGESPSEAETRLRAILGPGNRVNYQDHPLA
ncbi:hypothetical protein CVT26_010868 [Gymnopilus dilepis]|uniref:Uncharacterized protein n=1 Tax=Gymnopilus dilepis TaxID=231916 RepID=A0A409VIS9_9AGAR|nr:hypothetical protein CVT26_010868 [Gymnopilus dilepis]